MMGDKVEGWTNRSRRGGSQGDRMAGWPDHSPYEGVAWVSQNLRSAHRRGTHKERASLFPRSIIAAQRTGENKGQVADGHR